MKILLKSEAKGDMVDVSDDDADDDENDPEDDDRDDGNDAVVTFDDEFMILILMFE